MRLLAAIGAGLLASLAIAACTSRVALPEDASGTTDSASLDASALDAGAVADAPASDTPHDTTCASVQVDARPLVPNVVLVIDQSGSMSMPFDGTMSRWQTLETAFVGTGGLVATLQGTVRFGAVMFTDDPEVLGCPDLATTPAAYMALANIQQLYSTNGPSGNTPTGDTIDWVTTNRVGIFSETMTPGREVIILATDGEPGTCAASGDVTMGRAASVAATQRAFAAGIRTYVVSVGTEIANMHLQDVANAGVGVMPGDPNAPYWIASDGAGIRGALTAITSRGLPCTLELMGRIDPARACEGTVTLGTSTLACGTDWSAVDATHITLGDATCMRLRTAGETLVATFPCDVIVP